MIDLNSVDTVGDLISGLTWKCSMKTLPASSDQTRSRIRPDPNHHRRRRRRRHRHLESTILYEYVKRDPSGPLQNLKSSINPA